MNQNTLPIKDARDALLERLDRIDNYSDLEIGFLIEYYPILVDRILHELRVIKLIGTESEHKKEYINDPSRIRNLLQDIDEVSIGIDNLQAGYISLGNAKIYDIFADPSNDYGNKGVLGYDNSPEVVAIGIQGEKDQHRRFLKAHGLGQENI